LVLAMALAADARRVWGEGVQLAHVLMLVHRRLAEASRDQEALAAATEAESLFTHAGDEASASSSRRSRGASLLVLERLDEAFAVLELAMEKKGPLFGGGGAFAMVRGEGKRAQALQEAASICGWAALTTPEWVRALGGIAQGFDDPKLWERFDRALRTMLEGSERPGEDLGVVLRQASQRRFRKTVTRAQKIAKELGVEPVETFHF